jgi:signal transduction histidine kinase
MKSEDGEEVGMLLERVHELAHADLVTLVFLTPSGDEFVVDRAVGLGADQLMTMSFPLAGSLVAKALSGGEPIRVSGFSELEYFHGFEIPSSLGSAMLIPFDVAHDEHSGVLSIARTTDREGFGARDLEMGVSFASHISVAIDRADARITRRRMALLEDRSRIARDLHDHVIQRLFATGLNLQAAAAAVEPSMATRIVDQIKEIDGAIAQIRQSIFAIRQDTETTAVSLRARILEIVDRIGDQLPSRPRVTFLGPVDLMADADLTDDVSAVVTEALANTVRHAGATKVEVTVSAASGLVSIEVVDDGKGPGESPRLSGLDNLRDRAESRGGTFEIEKVTMGGGTRVTWTVPT